MAKRGSVPFPTKEQVLEYIRGSDTPVGKREIARAFHITGDDRSALKAMIRELEHDGSIERGRSRKLAPPAALPAVAVIRVVEIDADGEVVAAPGTWPHEQPAPRIYLAPDRRSGPAPGLGDRVLARLRRLSDGSYEAKTIRRLEGPGSVRVVGRVRQRPDGSASVEPVNKRQRDPIAIGAGDAAGVEDGELVVVELSPAGPVGGKRAAVVERLGDADHPGAISLIAIHTAGIPTEFPSAALTESASAAAPRLDDRADLRELPLVTIDGPDARDFDDAVWAEADSDPANPGGWHLVVAIADVAHYVRPGSALDREALKRGNSCYFPDRVVPMLPEALSNGQCSLVPGEDRACLAAHIWIDGEGRLRRHRFIRGLMRSAARLTYEQVQRAADGQPDDATAPLLGAVVKPLYGAFAALASARDDRGTLDLDVPERTIELDEDGTVRAIGVRHRLDSHRLIEEFMIAANVAAAEALQKRNFACLYRVHDQPDRAKLDALRDVLEPLGYRLAKGQVPKPRQFTQVLKRANGRPEADLVSQLILRSQAQAIYSPDNIGHFGLALSHYAHFTSPIRRYADLVVHRALIRVLGLGGGGLDDEGLSRLEEIVRQVSTTERRAASAERDAVDRYAAAYLSGREGSLFTAAVSGVTRFGLFVTLSETGTDGLIPVSTLPEDYYVHDERSHALVGERWGRVYRLGRAVRVRLVEADAITGSTVFALADDDGADLPWLAAPAAARSGRRSGRSPGPARSRAARRTRS